MLVTEPRRISTYDFRRPNKLNREHVRALQIVGETFARQFTTILSTSLRTLSHVTMSEATQYTYDEYIQELPNPTLLMVLDLAPLEGVSLFNLPIDVSMSMVDRLLGGSGSIGSAPDRAPTDIENRLIRGIIERGLRELAYAFESLLHIEPRISRTETNPQFAQIAAPTDMIVVIPFTIRLDGVSGDMSLAIPFGSLAPALEDTADTNDPDRAVRLGEIRHALEGGVQAARTDVRVRFDEAQLTSKQLAALRPGDILPLEHPVDAPLTVEIAGLPRFRATAGTRGKRVACLLTDTISEVS